MELIPVTEHMSVRTTMRLHMKYLLRKNYIKILKNLQEYSYFEKEYLYSSDNDFNTVGGLVLKLLEHIPQSGECVEWKDFKFEIMDMDGARIDKILVVLTCSEMEK